MEVKMEVEVEMGKKRREKKDGKKNKMEKNKSKFYKTCTPYAYISNIRSSHTPFRTRLIITLPL